MRGIHREAFYNDLPVKGTGFSARDIAEPFDTCNWCNHMYGVDQAKEGAQEYYNSLFELYASWEIDFVKVVHPARDPVGVGVEAIVAADDAPPGALAETDVREQGVALLIARRPVGVEDTVSLIPLAGEVLGPGP